MRNATAVLTAALALASAMAGGGCAARPPAYPLRELAPTEFIVELTGHDLDRRYVVVTNAGPQAAAADDPVVASALARRDVTVLSEGEDDGLNLVGVSGISETVTAEQRSVRLGAEVTTTRGLPTDPAAVRVVMALFPIPRDRTDGEVLAEERPREVIEATSEDGGKTWVGTFAVPREELPWRIGGQARHVVSIMIVWENGRIEWTCIASVASESPEPLPSSRKLERLRPPADDGDGTDDDDGGG